MVKHSMRRIIFSAIIIVIVCLCGLLLEKSVYFARTKEALNSLDVPSALLNFGPMGKILKQHNLVVAVPNDFSRYPKVDQQEGTPSETSIFQKKRKVGKLVFRSNPKGSKGLQSSQVVKDTQFIPEWPLLSIEIEENDLHDKDTGIIANRMQRGREWEKLAYVTYYENGTLLFATGTGIRMHGGVHGRAKFNSYRLYFRKEYGANHFKPGILFGPKSEPLKRLVVHHTDWPPYPIHSPFNNPLAYDIARRIGSIAPETKMVLLYLNGEYQGIHFIVPHQSKKQLSSYFGHDNFDYYRFRSRNSYDSKAFYINKFWTTFHKTDPFTMEAVGKHIDLDNLARHLFSFAFCATTDYCQGTALCDNRNPNRKLFWMNWDMDHSFIDIMKSYLKAKKGGEVWAQPGLGMFLKAKHCGRARLFTRLISQSAEYQNFVGSLFLELMNHRINADYLQSRVDHYECMLFLMPS